MVSEYQNDINSSPSPLPEPSVGTSQVYWCKSCLSSMMDTAECSTCDETPVEIGWISTFV